MSTKNFIHSFKTKKSPDDVFQLLLQIEVWWSGLYEETIQGKSQNLDDEFSFRAGNGAHYSKQKLIELIPGKRIVWLVTESKLDFLDKPNEWTGTKISFEVSWESNKTKVTFIHEGLRPQLACYKSCSDAWTNYLQKFDQELNRA